MVLDYDYRELYNIKFLLYANSSNIKLIVLLYILMN